MQLKTKKVSYLVWIMYFPAANEDCCDSIENYSKLCLRSDKPLTNREHIKHINVEHRLTHKKQQHFECCDTNHKNKKYTTSIQINQYSQSTVVLQY